jgi:hypothetical protein
MMKNLGVTSLLILVINFCTFNFSQPRQESCTSAVISGEGSANGTPILWKNRDTRLLSNKVVYVKESPYSYLALVNANSDSGRVSYAGLNSVGFAIMNTVGYNLPEKSNEMKDLEGFIMAAALRTCRSVEDFERFIKANLGPSLGSLANFGIIDAGGRAVIFEIHNHGYKIFDSIQTSEKYLINTNFARSGKLDKGAGYLRFERATELFKTFSPGKVTYKPILCQFTRDIGHVLVQHPHFEELKKIPAEQDLWISTADCINKRYTSAAVVIIGKNPNDKDSLATMWVIPGEPVCAVALPLWVEAGMSPEAFWKGEKAPLWEESLRIKDIIRPLKGGSRRNYLNLTKLDNADGTGFLPKILKVEQEILKMTGTFLQKKRSSSELAEFQTRMAQKVLQFLKNIN